MSRKALVLDANILIRAVLGRKVRALVTGFVDQIDLFTSTLCFKDARKYPPRLLAKRGIAAEPALAVFDLMSELGEPVEPDWLDRFEAQARRLLRPQDEQDWPILAAAFALDCPIWTEDRDFFGAGVATHGQQLPSDTI